MSHTEFHFGKVKEITLPDNQTIEDFCKEKCESKELKSYNKTWLEQYNDEFGDYQPGSFLLIKDKVYEFIEHQEDDDDEYSMKLIKNDDDSITFMTKFYNGGTCFQEMITEALERL